MLIKYRVHEVSKDLNVPSKDVVELLKKALWRDQETYDRIERG